MGSVVGFGFEPIDVVVARLVDEMERKEGASANPPPKFMGGGMDTTSIVTAARQDVQSITRQSPPLAPARRANR
jgi:hypothetical protein